MAPKPMGPPGPAPKGLFPSAQFQPPKLKYHDTEFSTSLFLSFIFSLTTGWMGTYTRPWTNGRKLFKRQTL